MYLINEKIVGNIGFVYHRTKSVESIQGMMKDGFQPGNGAMYGKGGYFTYELESQLSPSMKTYGDFITKFYVSNLSAYLIFDEDMAKLVLGSKWSIRDQLYKFGFDSLKKLDTAHSLYGELENVFHQLDTSQGTPMEIKTILDKTKNKIFYDRNNDSMVKFSNIELQDGIDYVIELEAKKKFGKPSKFSLTSIKLTQYETFRNFFLKEKGSMGDFIEELESMKGLNTTSDQASHFYSAFPDIIDNKKIMGMVFTGRHDGRVLVSYRPETLKLVAYKPLKITGNTTNSLDSNEYFTTKFSKLKKNIIAQEAIETACIMFKTKSLAFGVDKETTNYAVKNFALSIDKIAPIDIINQGLVIIGDKYAPFWRIFSGNLYTDERMLSVAEPFSQIRSPEFREIIIDILSVMYTDFYEETQKSIQKKIKKKDSDWIPVKDFN